MIKKLDVIHRRRTETKKKVSSDLEHVELELKKVLTKIEKTFPQLSANAILKSQPKIKRL